MQIAKHLQKVLNTDHVAIFIDAKHLCVSSRGVKDDSTSTITSYVGGKFQEENTKREFLSSIQG
jgi:GTP cyclohydrolase I